MNSTSPPTVSVVIPAYNVEEYVADAVTSSLRQTHPPKEIICVDDGSTDGTLEVLRGLESQHPEHINVLTGPNRGPSAARNRGMERASGEYIQFLDADDTLLPEKLERDVAVLDENREALLFGSFKAFKGKTKIDESDTFVSDDPWVCLAKGNFGFTSSNLFRADAVEQVGGWDEQRPFREESDLIARMLMDGADVSFAHHKSTHARGRADSISADWGRDMRIARAELDRDILRHLRSVDGDRDRIDAIEEAVFLRLRQLYQFDSDAAVHLHRETFPDDYTPSTNGGNTTAYCTAYRVMGFSAAERLKTLFQKVRS
jgi:glycosyltransferase involved in cell wall biosynthesis